MGGIGSGGGPSVVVVVSGGGGGGLVVAVGVVCCLRDSVEGRVVDEPNSSRCIRHLAAPPCEERTGPRRAVQY